MIIPILHWEALVASQDCIRALGFSIQGRGSAQLARGKQGPAPLPLQPGTGVRLGGLGGSPPPPGTHIFVRGQPLALHLSRMSASKPMTSWSTGACFGTAPT